MNVTELAERFNRGGYASTNDVLNRVFNISLASVLILLSCPLLVVIALAIKLQDRGSILYKGTRLGMKKIPFTMYKFRTLVEDAESKIGARLIEPNLRLETRFGKFLRDTRLDELPQLVNIFKGEMNFFGPRPERPIIYETLCKDIPNYDRRFIVKPGLVGYSQLFTPHSADKEIRTLIDNKFLNKYQDIVTDLLMVLLTIAAVALKIVHKGSSSVSKMIKSKLFGLYTEKRVFTRVKTKGAAVYVRDNSRPEDKPVKCRLIDINEQAFSIGSPSKIHGDDLLFEMEVIKKRKLGLEKRKKYCLCRGYIYKKKTVISKAGEELIYIVMYTPASPLNKYMVRKYLIKESVI